MYLKQYWVLDYNLYEVFSPFFRAQSPVLLYLNGSVDTLYFVCMYIHIYIYIHITSRRTSPWRVSTKPLPHHRLPNQMQLSITNSITSLLTLNLQCIRNLSFYGHTDLLSKFQLTIPYGGWVCWWQNFFFLGQTKWQKFL